MFKANRKKKTSRTINRHKILILLHSRSPEGVNEYFETCYRDLLQQTFISSDSQCQSWICVTVRKRNPCFCSPSYVLTWLWGSEFNGDMCAFRIGLMEICFYVCGYVHVQSYGDLFWKTSWQLRGAHYGSAVWSEKTMFQSDNGVSLTGTEAANGEEM